MKNLLLIAVFAMLSTLTYGQKKIKVEKEVENGKETTRVWVDGKEVKEGSVEYEKYAEGDIEKDEKIWMKKRKGKDGHKEEIIIIGDEMDKVFISDDKVMSIDVDVEKDGEHHKVIIKKKGENGEEEIEEIILKGGDDNVIELDGDGNKKMIFIQVEEDIEVLSDEDVEVKVDVKADKKGKQKVIIKKKKDGKEEVEEIIIDDNGEETIIDGDTKVIIKTKKGMDLDLEGVDPDDIETIDVVKKDGVKKITITTKDGKTIEKELKGGDEDVKVIKKRIKKDNIEEFDFDLDGLDPEEIENIDIKKTDEGKTITIKTKDGKTIVKKVKED